MTGLPLTALLVVLLGSGQETEPGENAGDEASGAPEEPRPPSPPTSDEERNGSSPDPEEVRDRRLLRSDRWADRVLEAPRYILDVPWYPLKHFLNFSERVDLYERAQDFFYFNEERTAGWAPDVSLGGELGDAYGASVYHHDLFGKQHSADAGFTFASGEEYLWKIAYAVPRSEPCSWSSRLDISMMRDDDVDVFVTRDAQGRPVLGMATDDDEDVRYESRVFHSRVDVGWEPLAGFRLVPHVRGEISKAHPSGAASTAALAGLDGLDEEIGLVAAGLTVTIESLDNPLRPSRGWTVASAVEGTIAPEKTDAGNRFGHTDYSLDASVFLPLHGPHRVLVVRQLLKRVDPWGGNELAFYHQPILDLIHGLRSFERYRFRDRGVLLTSIEYRYPIWRTWDAYIFGDGGQTFHHYSDIDTDDFEFSVGGGIRFLTEDRFLLLVQIGYGSEGTEVHFSVGQVF